jgi:hypothetical protein
LDEEWGMTKGNCQMTNNNCLMANVGWPMPDGGGRMLMPNGRTGLGRWAWPLTVNGPTQPSWASFVISSAVRHE